ncbi:MAG: MarR family winged helix-turn-helix transcriptional regulator [Acidimicrobiales bacterium]
MTSRRTTQAAGGAERGPQELAELLSHAARRLRRGTMAHLAPLGITMAQARVLRLLAGGPLRMADIAARTDVVPRTATGMVDGLEETGLVIRRPDPDDRRSVLVEMSPKGEHLLAHLDKARRASATEVFAVLQPAERAQLLALLGRLCERGQCNACHPANGGQ